MEKRTGWPTWERKEEDGGTGALCPVVRRQASAPPKPTWNE